LLQTNWYVTHAGLLRIARRNRCSGMRVQFIRELSDTAARRFAFQATVFKSKTCRGFVGYGDADPSNVSALVRGEVFPHRPRRLLHDPSALAVHLFGHTFDHSARKAVKSTQTARR